MTARDLIDKSRKDFVNSDMATTRPIKYTRSSDELLIPLNSFVSGNEFNQDEKDDKKVNRITCRGLHLEKEPTTTDKILYDGKIYSVRMWDKSGNTYVIIAENAKRNKVSSRDFK